MEALGALAVAARHIRALGTARADRGPAGDCAHYVRRDPASRVVPPRSASGAWRHARLALPVRQGRQSVRTATERSTSNQPVQPNFSWRPDERSESGLGRACSPGTGGRSPWSPERALFSRVLCGAVARARISLSATASGPKAFNAHERVRCCRRDDFLPGINGTKPALHSLPVRTVRERAKQVCEGSDDTLGARAGYRPGVSTRLCVCRISPSNVYYRRSSLSLRMARVEVLPGRRH